jgi:hypothetical protein
MPLKKQKKSPAICLPSVLAIGFTGHRSLKDEDQCREAIRSFLREQKEAHAGIVYGVSSAAAGGDQLFAESCLELGIPVRILLPKPEEEFKKDFDGWSWQRTERIIEKALCVEVTGRNQGRSEQYYDCGIQTVGESQVLVALWDGAASRGVGGTQEIVAFAEKTGYPVAWIDAETTQLRWLNGEALKQTRSHPEQDFLNDLSDGGVTLASGTPRDLAEAWQRKMDENANRSAPQARRVASIPVVYTAAAAVLSGVAPEIPAAAPWLAVSAALGLVALALPAVLRLHARQAKWARTRTAAEISRSVLALWNTPGLFHALGSEAIAELSAMVRSLNFLKMQDRLREKRSLDSFRQEYVKDRVEDQIKYFTGQAKKAARQERIYGAVSWICGVLATLVAAGCLTIEARWRGQREIHGHEWIALTMSALFEISTMAGAFALMKDCGRRRRRYGELSEWLKSSKTQLENLRTWTSILRIAERVERALLVELLEWRSVVQGAATHRK